MAISSTCLRLNLKPLRIVWMAMIVRASHCLSSRTDPSAGTQQQPRWDDNDERRLDDDRLDSQDYDDDGESVGLK